MKCFANIPRLNEEPVLVRRTLIDRLKAMAWALLVCLVVAMGIQRAATAFLDHYGHPGWDFVLRHGEVSCLSQLHVDPYDIFAENIRNDRFLPYYLEFKERDDALNYHWCAGYPPWEYTLLFPLSRFSVRTADAIYKAFELLSLFIVIVFSFRRSFRFETSTWTKFLLAYSVFLLPHEAWNHVFWSGNWTLPFCAGVVCLVLFLDKGWQVLAGFAWAFLMIKPQQGIWFAIPLLFRRQFKTIGVAVATCLVASVPPAVLCGKSPVELILEIPKFRVQAFFETTLFPPSVYSFSEQWLFPKSALFFGLVICLVFCVWASWKWRKAKDWFVFLQPTFFCICAGYPLWKQDWLFFFFPVFFLLETWTRFKTTPRSIRTIALVLAIAATNPLSWILNNTSWGVGTVLIESEVLSCVTWALFAFLVLLVQSCSSIQNGELFFSSRSDYETPVDVHPANHSTDLLRSSVSGTLLPFLLLSILLVGLVYAAYIQNGCLLGIDDADIFFGYAENLCRGRGISYAQNGVHCEGTTSMFWLLLCSMCFKLRLNEPGVLAVSFVLLLSAQWMWLKILAELLSSRNRSPVCFFVYVVVVLSSAGYVAWMSVTLMDTVLWGIVVAWMTLALFRETEPEAGAVRDRLVAAVPFALAPWARPEAMLVIPCGLALSALFRYSRNKTIRNEIVWGGAFFLSLAGLTGFRLLYFGYPFPNTFYAKVSPSFIYNVQQGTYYLLEYVRSGAFTYLAAICFVVTVGKVIMRLFRKTGTRTVFLSEVEFLWLWCFVLILPPVFAGGDHFGYSRFFQPVWPLLCILLVSVFSSLVSEKWPLTSGVDWARVVVIFAFILFSFFSSGKKWGKNPAWSGSSPIHHEFPIAETGRNDGRMLSGMFDGLPEKPILGVISAGGISRTYQGKIVDLMGLNSIDIAHHPGDRQGFKNHAAFEPEIFDSLHVDIMPFTPAPFRSHALKGMLETESFVANWRCGRIRKDATGEETPPFFVENGFLDRLLSTGDFSFRDSYRFEDGRWTEIKEAAAD